MKHQWIIWWAGLIPVLMVAWVFGWVLGRGFGRGFGWQGTVVSWLINAIAGGMYSTLVPRPRLSGRLRRRWHRWRCGREHHSLHVTWAMVTGGPAFRMEKIVACRWCHELEASISARSARRWLEKKKTGVRQISR